ncbi:MAG: class I SAM-dependent methyltransferase [Lachnospiraceae bacterium]|nr:class I SAM-dependent methyltransferase [Lachnospiraceae bacterium]MBQ6993042.1 class I SAM-dependent methyltransferase [Lachnospiraceae bacterium]
MSKDMLKVAQDKIRKNGLKNIRLLEMDATHLKFKSNCFDKILIALVLLELDEELVAK